MAFKDNLRLEYVYFQNIKSTIDVLKSWKGETEDGKTTDIIDAVIGCDSAILLLYKNIGECWNELTAQIQKEMKDLGELKEKVENYHDELNEKIDDVNNYIMAIIREIEERLDSLEARMELVEDDLATLQRNRIFELVYSAEDDEWSLTYNGAVVDFDDAYELLVSEEGVLGNGWVKYTDPNDDTKFYYLPLTEIVYDEIDPDSNCLYFETLTTNHIDGWSGDNGYFLDKVRFTIDLYGTSFRTLTVYQYGASIEALKSPCDYNLAPISASGTPLHLTPNTDYAPLITADLNDTFALPQSTHNRVRYLKFNQPNITFNYVVTLSDDVYIPYDCEITIKLAKENDFNDDLSADKKLIGVWQVSLKGVFIADQGESTQRIYGAGSSGSCMIDLGNTLAYYMTKYNKTTLHIHYDVALTCQDVAQTLNITDLDEFEVVHTSYKV